MHRIRFSLFLLRNAEIIVFLFAAKTRCFMFNIVRWHRTRNPRNYGTRQKSRIRGWTAGDEIMEIRLPTCLAFGHLENMGKKDSSFLSFGRLRGKNAWREMRRCFPSADPIKNRRNSQWTFTVLGMHPSRRIVGGMFASREGKNPICRRSLLLLSHL